MIKFTRCPKCSTLYELEGVDYSESGGWVQCGDCERKFKVSSHAVEPDELSFTVSNIALDESMKLDGAVDEKFAESSMQIMDEQYSPIEQYEITDEQEITDDITNDDSELLQPLELTLEDPSLGEVTSNLDDLSSELSGVEDDQEPISVDAQEPLTIDSNEQTETNSLEEEQLIKQTQESDSEFMENTIIVPEEAVDDEDFENIFKNFSEDIFKPELIDEEDSHETTRRANNTYEQIHSEFSEEEIVIESEFSEKTILEEELETNSQSYISEELSDNDSKNTINLASIIPVLASVVLTVGLIALFALQVHGRGLYEWIPQDRYEGLLSRVPVLTHFEKKQTDLSAIHLASTRMEVNQDNPVARIITLQLVNQSFTNQAYPDFQLEFTDAKGDTIARKIIVPSFYLEKGHIGFLESRQAKVVSLKINALPESAVGYQITVVQQSS